MKKQVLFVTLTALVGLTLVGCIRAPFVPPTGSVFSQINAPLDVDFQNTDLSGLKKGTAETISILGLFATGDVSSQAAAQNGGITKIMHADYEYFNVLGVFQKTTVIVYGK